MEGTNSTHDKRQESIEGQVPYVPKQQFRRLCVRVRAAGSVVQITEIISAEGQGFGTEAEDMPSAH